MTYIVRDVIVQEEDLETGKVICHMGQIIVIYKRLLSLQRFELEWRHSILIKIAIRGVLQEIHEWVEDETRFALAA